MTLQAFDPHQADRSAWRHFHHVRRLLAAEDAGGEPVPDDDTVEHRMTSHRDPQWSSMHWLAFDHGEPAGRLQIATRGGGDPQRYAGRVFVSGGVCPAYRRRGIASRMAMHLVEAMRQEGHAVALFPVPNVGSAMPFFDRLGARLAYRSFDSHLRLENVDDRALQSWAGRADAGLRWEVHLERVPLDRLRALAPHVNELLAAVPRQTLDLPAPVFEVASCEAMYRRMDASGGAHLFVLLHSGTRLVAVCETIVDDTDHAIQKFTGVAPAWRGSGLALAVKARSIELLRLHHPRVAILQTQNAANNAPMLRVNERLGFRPIRSSGVFEIGLDALAHALSR